MFAYNLRYLTSLLLLGLFTATQGGEIKLKSPGQDIIVTPHAYGHFTFGQLVRATGIETIKGSFGIDGLWTEDAFTEISLNAEIGKHLFLRFGIATVKYFSWPQEAQFYETKYARDETKMGETYAKLILEKNRLGDLYFTAGNFDYKYNPDVRNLGEFLFRSATYPLYIRTNFDDTKARLLGFRANHTFLDGSVSYDLILHTETEYYPAMDWTLSALCKYDPANLHLVEIGAGVSFAHLLSVYNDDYDKKLGKLTHPRNLGLAGNQYITADGDTAFYSFKGTKVMGRLSLNPKALLPSAEEYFHEEALKIYVEAMLGGVKSYPDTNFSGVSTSSYKRWQEKTILTFGFNLPTFKMLDLLNFEFEYWGSKYYNTYREVYLTLSLPTPQPTIQNISESKWKWSVFTRKYFFNKHTAITLQLARDHMRLPSVRYSNANHREMLVEAGNWWWAVKSSFQF